MGTAVTREHTFAARLAELRRAAGLSKYELGKRSGVTAQAIGKLEAGAKPSWESVRRLARALGVSVAEFDVGPLTLPDQRERAARHGRGKGSEQ
jgi:transcriptional regulator with XRE-family HTH domain